MFDASTPPDVTTLARSLDSKAILARLEQLAEEEKELRILLRAARERDRMLGRRREVSRAC